MKRMPSLEESFGSKQDVAALMRDMLLRRIESGEFLAGSKLPTERVLCDVFSTSRSVVRRALATLKEQGLITQRVGSGTFVVGKPIARVLPDISPAELMEARLAWEPMIVDLVVRNANAADFARLEECLRKADAAATVEQFEQWDSALHHAIAEATHNSFIISVFDLMHQVREQGAWGQLKKGNSTLEHRREYQVEHRAVVGALKDRDSDGARLAMEKHLHHVRRDVLRL